MMRKPLSKSLRAAILERDNWTCQYCGITEARSWEVDHVIPVIHGGTNALHNLVTACDACNGQKHATVRVPRNLAIICAGRPEYAARVQSLVGAARFVPTSTSVDKHVRWCLDEMLSQRGISARSLCQVTGLATSTISQARTNKTDRIDLGTLGKLVQFFNCTVDDLLGFD